MNSYTNWNCSNFIDWDRNPVHNFIDFSSSSSSSSMPTTSLPSYPQFPDYPAAETGCLKREEVCFGLEEGNYGNGRIGLDLKYFPSRETAVLNCLFKRSRRFYQVPRCQAKGCNVYLTNAKQYHRRHKVCEFHSKATKVLLADDGLEQRFCQQCSRFHVLAEFDDTKRSCRRRLADHNRRRRKPQPGTISNSEARKTAQNGEERSQENTRAYSFSLLMTKDSKSSNVEELQKVAVTQLQKGPALSLGGIEIFQRCLEPPNAVYTHQPFSSPSSFFEREIVSPSSSLIHNCCHSNPFSDALQSADGGSGQTHHRHQQQQEDLQILMEVEML